MLLYVERPAPEQEPRPTPMIDGNRAAGTVSHPVFATPRELERLLADDLATSFSENFASAAGVAMADLPGNAGLSRMRNASNRSAMPTSGEPGLPEGAYSASRMPPG